MKLNIGCGTDYRKDWINVDFNKDFNPDVYFDINTIYDGKKFPFEDKTFDKIIIFDVLEHFPYPLPILRELYRICKVDGSIKIKVPYGVSVWNNLDHKRMFFIASFHVNNFENYCSGSDKQVEIIEKYLYILPTKSLLKKYTMKIFLKIMNNLISKNKERLYDQTILKNIFQNTNICITYRRLK